MKKTLILTLLCINVGLLAALILTSTERVAYAQVRETDYLTITGKIGPDWDGVFVVDLATRRLIGFRLDRERMRLVALSNGRDLVRDFNRTGPAGPR